MRTKTSSITKGFRAIRIPDKNEIRDFIHESISSYLDGRTDGDEVDEMVDDLHKYITKIVENKLK